MGLFWLLAVLLCYERCFKDRGDALTLPRMPAPLSTLLTKVRPSTSGVPEGEHMSTNVSTKLQVCHEIVTKNN